MTAHSHFASTPPFPSAAYDASQPIAVWNGSRGQFSWISSRGRDLFRKPADELSVAIHQNTLRKLNAIALTSKAAPAAAIVLRFKGTASLACAAETLRLANGDHGVLLYPRKPEGGVGDKTAYKAINAPDKGHVSGRAKPLGNQTNLNPRPFTPPVLTAEEWRSFKSIGRKVRKLCREKQSDVTLALPRAASNPPVSPHRPHAAHVTDLIPVFDVFLVLDQNWRVIQSRGALSRFGWQTRALRGQTPSQLFGPREAAGAVKGMNSVEATGKSVRKTVLIPNASAGGMMSCKALFGVWSANPARYFVGLIGIGIVADLVQVGELHRSKSALRPLAA